MQYLIYVLLVLQVFLSSAEEINSVMLQRTVCYGTCPSYSVQIFSDGKVIYYGGQFVKVQGKRTYSVPVDSVKSLFRFVVKINFFSLQNEYTSKLEIHTRPDGIKDTVVRFVTDAPNKFITIQSRDLTKTIKDYYAGPRELEELEQIIDRIAQTSVLIKTK